MKVCDEKIKVTSICLKEATRWLGAVSAMYTLPVKKELERPARILRVRAKVDTPCLNEKIDSGNTHLQDLAQWWRTSQGVDIPKISQFYWGLFEKTRFFVFLHYKINGSKGVFWP